MDHHVGVWRAGGANRAQSSHLESPRVFVHTAGHTGLLSDVAEVRGEAVVVMSLAVLNPWLAATTTGATTATTDDAAAVIVVVSLEAQVGSLYGLQVLASQLVPQLSRPVSTPLLTLLYTLEEAAGEEGHGHEQDDGTAHNGGDHCHLEAKGLVRRHSFAHRAS